MRKVTREIFENGLKPSLQKNGKGHVYTSNSFPQISGYSPSMRGQFMRRMQQDGIFEPVKSFYSSKEVKEYVISGKLASMPIPQIMQTDYKIMCQQRS